ncbi:acyl-CoA dehydrogenase family protein [Roseococcus sp. DSY-14]|uniref:acyl-CoA dehydrogenase family protein n=1 Tax=Roseococcus sp. DSY-14 TaxID=3369650 RepID=UPI00387B6D62
MELNLDPRSESFRQRIRAFVEARIIPLEADRANYDAHENIAPAVLARLRAEAKAEGLWCLQLPPEHGGQGLPFTGMVACYEEMNRSIFGPVVFNSAAPDDGNMMVMAKLATPAQQEWWLKPVIAGECQSAFAMTEPGEGAGSDPGMTLTAAERVGNDRWRITGRKWFITGAGEAKRFILMARTSDDARRGLTAFLFDASQPGWRIERRIPIMGPEEHGGHCELVFDGLEIPDENVLMGVGDGLKVTQIRLGPARLTHCMRWGGLARRCLEIALERAETRRAFGQTLVEKESVQMLLAGAAMQLDTARMLTMRAAWLLDQGSYARKEISLAKVAAANALHGCADVALQLLGAKGYSKDTVVEWIYRYARQARLVDGADEVHRMVVANFLRKERDGFFAWGHHG